MPTVMNRHQMYRHTEMRSAPQKVCIGLGVAFVMIGLTGVVLPGLLRMHLSITHNFIHILTGVLAIASGFTSPKRAINVCLLFGAFYGFLGILGFIVGSPGYPAFGYMEADQNLFRVVPNVLELGTADHLVHMLLSAIFLFTAYAHRKDKLDRPINIQNERRSMFKTERKL